VLNLETSVSNAGVEMVVYLASSRLTTGELLGLAVGDVIKTENDSQCPLEVCVEGRPKFYGFAGLLKGHKAVRIGKPVVPPEEVVERKLAVSGGGPAQQISLPPGQPPGPKLAGKP
jgi:flagellar motor switch protein FliM